MNLNFVHPLAICAYVLLAVGFLCAVSTKAQVTDFFPGRSIKYCMNQAMHLHRAAKSPNPALQLVRYSCALAYVSSARALAPDNDTIVRQVHVDPAELAAAIAKDARPLLEQAKIQDSEFRAVFA
jgi:hypothetical protein